MSLFVFDLPVNFIELVIHLFADGFGSRYGLTVDAAAAGCCAFASGMRFSMGKQTNNNFGWYEKKTTKKRN